MSQGTRKSASRARNTLAASGIVAGSLALAAPADAVQSCSTGAPAGASACITVDTVAGKPNQVQRISVSVTHTRNFSWDVSMRDGQSLGFLTLQGRQYVTGPATVTKDLCTQYSGLPAYGSPNSKGCGSYTPNSNVTLSVYGGPILADSFTATVNLPVSSGGGGGGGAK